MTDDMAAAAEAYAAQAWADAHPGVPDAPQPERCTCWNVARDKHQVDCRPKPPALPVGEQA